MKLNSLLRFTLHVQLFICHARLSETLCVLIHTKSNTDVSDSLCELMQSEIQHTHTLYHTPGETPCGQM